MGLSRMVYVMKEVRSEVRLCDKPESTKSASARRPLVAEKHLEVLVVTAGAIVHELRKVQLLLELLPPL
jgi:Na+-transporting methylmalonyl-CoA/oxaloacetate decarboxylase gamma subunit